MLQIIQRKVGILIFEDGREGCLKVILRTACSSSRNIFLPINRWRSFFRGKTPSLCATSNRDMPLFSKAASFAVTNGLESKSLP